MDIHPTDPLIVDYHAHIEAADFPCVAAKAALHRAQVDSFVANDMASATDDGAILTFLYRFIDHYRDADAFFSSAAILFRQPVIGGEAEFDRLLWQRLQALSETDAERYGYDARVSADPDSPKFSFSLKEEAFFVIGLHPDSAREARRFKRPALVFNPHDQFETLREKGSYQHMRDTIRKRDVEAHGSINPMLDDFGGSSEVYQYSGRRYDQAWKCPFAAHHRNA